MKIFACEKCGSIDLYIDDRGNQKALMCNYCEKWIKWIGKNEIQLVQKQLENTKGMATIQVGKKEELDKEIFNAITLLVKNGYEVRHVTELK